MSKHLNCQMTDECPAPVSMIDEKGFVYCAEHGIERRVDHGRRCRKLRPAEIKRLENGLLLGGYSPKRIERSPR